MHDIKNIREDLTTFEKKMSNRNVKLDTNILIELDKTKRQKIQAKEKLEQEKKIIVTIKKMDLAKDMSNARPEVFSKENALDAKITELDLKNRKVKLSVKAAQIDEEKSLVAKFGEGATKSGATLKGIFEKALGRKVTKKDK